ncbi:hypothetical protein ABIB73_003966 [Bradyrhizobium sp. F1.4.3]|uniref:hypothetical protein n=1 Tax=Bradyrhizobium sp. F1.4.3 TaxID=3156356 RepID=UPI0033988E43
MTKTAIFTALRLILSLAIAGPAQAWPGQPGGAGIVSPSGALAVALVRKPAPAHSHIRKTEHATIALPPMRSLSDREQDPLASMHFE